jgi:hypothetical protein
VGLPGLEPGTSSLSGTLRPFDTPCDAMLGPAAPQVGGVGSGGVVVCHEAARGPVSGKSLASTRGARSPRRALGTAHSTGPPRERWPAGPADGRGGPEPLPRPGATLPFGIRTYIRISATPGRSAVRPTLHLTPPSPAMPASSSPAAWKSTAWPPTAPASKRRSKPSPSSPLASSPTCNPPRAPAK